MTPIRPIRSVVHTAGQPALRQLPPALAKPFDIVPSPGDASRGLIYGILARGPAAVALLSAVPISHFHSHPTLAWVFAPIALAATAITGLLDVMGDVTFRKALKQIKHPPK